MPVLIPPSSPLLLPDRRWPWKCYWTNLWISSSMAIKLLEIPDPTLVRRLETPKFRVYWYPQGNLFKVQNSWVSDPRSLALSLGIWCNTLRQTHFLQFFQPIKQYSLHYNPGYIWNKFHKSIFPRTKKFPILSEQCWSNLISWLINESLPAAPKTQLW